MWQILLPIVSLIESASEVVQNVIHEIQIHTLETIVMLGAEVADMHLEPYRMQ